MAQDNKDEPQSITVNTGGNGARVAGHVVSQLGVQPIFLVVILMNAIFCGAAAYYLLEQEKYRHAERSEVLNLMRFCIGSSVMQKDKEDKEDKKVNKDRLYPPEP